MHTLTFRRSETVEYVIEQDDQMQVTARKVENGDSAQSIEVLSLGVMHDIKEGRGGQQLVDKLNDLRFGVN